MRSSKAVSDQIVSGWGPCHEDARGQLLRPLYVVGSCFTPSRRFAPTSPIEGEADPGFFASPLMGEVASLRERVGVRAGDIFSSQMAHASRAEFLIPAPAAGASTIYP